MKCDLTFVPRADAPSRGEFETFVEERRWYRGDDEGFDYHDEDTGVAFRLDWRRGDSGELAALEFGMSYLRPRFFALEAGSELHALAEAFDLAVRTPSSGDGEPGRFTPEDFLDRWEEGHAAAVQSTESLSPFRLPREELRDVWRWNRARRDYQTVLGEGIYVPTLRVLEESGRLRRACVWPQTIPFALPAAAEYVLMAGVENEGLDRAPSKLRVVERSPLEELVETHVEKFERRSDPTEHMLIGWREPPAAFLEALTTLGDGADERDLTMIPPDKWVDEESVD